MTIWATAINLQAGGKTIQVTFDDGQIRTLSAELLRVASPSAEVQGHGPGQKIILLNKEKVLIKDIQPVGNYAVRLVFDDGHDTGLYTWDYLYKIGTV